jgi:hypothetical protein
MATIAKIHLGESGRFKVQSFEERPLKIKFNV